MVRSTPNQLSTPSPLLISRYVWPLVPSRVRKGMDTSWPVPLVTESFSNRKRFSGERVWKDSPNCVFHALSTTEYVIWPTGARSPMANSLRVVWVFEQPDSASAAEPTRAQQNSLIIRETNTNVPVSSGSAQMARQPVQELGLRRDDLAPGRIEREPFGAVNFREFLRFSRLRRPDHGKGVAADAGRSEIALQSPGRDDLSASLSNFSERNEIASDRYPGFLLEFAAGRGEWIFIGFVLALGDRPSAFVFVLPERSSRMREQHFDLCSCATE